MSIGICFGGYRGFGGIDWMLFVSIVIVGECRFLKGLEFMCFSWLIGEYLDDSWIGILRL